MPCVPIRGARRRAPRQPRIAPVATRHARGPSAPSTAVGRRACGRPRRGSVAAVLPHWSHDDGRLPDGRLTRPRPQPAEGHGREAWCQQRSGTAGGRWEPRLPGQKALRLHPHAPVRAAFADFDLDWRGLRGRSRDGQAHGSLSRPWARPVRRWASRGARERNTSPKHRRASELWSIPSSHPALGPAVSTCTITPDDEQHCLIASRRIACRLGAHAWTLLLQSS